LVFPSRSKIIFVHGCFWHRHGKRCEFTRWPKSKLDFWKPKLEQNHRRDDVVKRRLRKLGWRVLVIWECQLKDNVGLTERVRAFLENT
jgi:DNA mismatch endonuclease, patch repair protein